MRCGDGVCLARLGDVRGIAGGEERHGHCGMEEVDRGYMDGRWVSPSAWYVDLFLFKW